MLGVAPLSGQRVFVRSQEAWVSEFKVRSGESSVGSFESCKFASAKLKGVRWCVAKSAWLMVLVCAAALGQGAGARKASEAMAASVMKAWPNGSVLTTKSPGQWGYEEGVLLDGIAAEWEQTHDPAELAYVKQAVDKYVTADGTIRMNAAGKPFGAGEHQLDWIEPGRAILFVYRQTHEAKYATAAKFLHDQLAVQPRGASGGYWHKQIYPNQMWLDGAYMAEPFRAEYAITFNQPGEFDDIGKQFLLMYERMRDPQTGLLRHGWDESKQMAWADKTTGLSPEVWARAMGWYCMALVDVLDWVPAGSSARAKLVDVLQKVMATVVKYQDPATGLWWQVMDKAAAPGNFLEASASSMFVYALEKGVRKGYLPQADKAYAAKGWAGIQKQFVKVNADGTGTLTGTVKAAGLGGKPYRSGTYEYYVGEARGEDDAKGVGAYLLAGSEMGRAK
jgi:unsaturated rhamnogalacturonyl hydrolase